MSTGDGENIGIKVQATGADQVQSQMTQVEQAVEHSTGYIRASMSGLTDVVERIKLPFAELAGILAGGVIFKDFIESTENLGVSLTKASEQTPGSRIEQLGGLKIAAEQNDVSFETLTKGLERLALGMQTSVQTPSATAKRAFDQLGISATDSTGRLRPVGDVMVEVANKFQNMEDGSGKTAIAMQIFGRAGAEMIPVLNLGGAAIQQYASDAQSMGAILSKTGAEDAEEFHQSMGRVGLVTQSLSNAIGTALMPALTFVANAFADSAKKGGLVSAAITIIKVVVEAVAAAFIGLQTTMEIVWAVGEAMAVSLAELFVQLGAALKDAAHGNFSGAADDLKQLTADVQSNVDKMVTDIVDNATKAGDALKKTLGIGADGSPAAPKTAAPPVQTTFVSQMPQFQEEWQEIKSGTSAFDEDLLQQERDFWVQKLSEVDKGTKDYTAILRQVNTLNQQIAKQTQAETVAQFKVEEAAANGNAAEIVQIKYREWLEIAQVQGDGSKAAATAYAAYLKAEEQEAQASALRQIQLKRDSSLASIDLARAQVDGERQLGTISDSQAIAQLRTLMEQEYQIKLDALNAQLALAKGNQDKIDQINDQITQLTNQHNAAVVQSTTQATLALKAQWTSVFSSITNAFQTSANGVIQGTQTMAQALSGLVRSIALDFASMEAGRLADHIATELAMTQASTAGGAARSTIDWWAAAQSVAAAAWRGIANITTYAAEAVAATYASVAAIPIVGPFLAPAMAIGIGAAVLGELGHIASAAGGYDIPSGVNPMTQLHASEMVLPASLANGIRNMVAGGGNSGDGSGGDTYNVQLSAVDAPSFEALCKRNPKAMAVGVKGAVRAGHLQGGPA